MLHTLHRMMESTEESEPSDEPIDPPPIPLTIPAITQRCFDPPDIVGRTEAQLSALATPPPLHTSADCPHSPRVTAAV